MHSSTALEEPPRVDPTPNAPEWPTIDEDLNPSHLEAPAWPVINAELTQKALAGDEASKGALNAYLEMASPEELLDPAVEPLLSNPSVRKAYVFPAIAEAAKRARSESGFEPAEAQLIRRTLESLGFAPQQSHEIWKSWNGYNIRYDLTDQSSGGIPEGKKRGDISEQRVETFGAIVKAHLMQMENIHSQDPEALQILFKRDHIRNFARYERQDLLDQARSNEVPDRLMIAMAEDHNNFSGSMKKSLHALRSGPTSPKKMRFVEAATKEEARQLLDENAAEAGPLQDVVFFVHADEDRLILSDRPGGTVSRSDIMGDKTKAPFLDNAVIGRGAQVLIIGCEAGVENGIAAAIAKKLHVRALAPDIKSTGLERSGVRLRSTAGTGEASKPIQAHGINPVRALALRILSRRTRRT